MTPEQRRKASIDLSLTYIQNYYPDWRLAKVLSNRKILNQRYDFYKDFITEIKSHHDESGDSTIAQEIKNGLHFDTISQCVQYVEDLFALINASTKPDYFIKNIINYDAGKVTNLIKSFNANITGKRISEAFHFPYDLKFNDEDSQSRFLAQVQYLTDLVKDVVKFHTAYEYFHNQYKHGLAVALRPFGNIYDQQQIDQDKRGEFEPFISVYDSRDINISAKKGTFSAKDGVFMLGFTENVQPFINNLIKESNYIRLVHPADVNLDIDILVDIAFKARACINTFLSNYSLRIKPEANENKFRLPVNYRSTEALVFSFGEEDK